MKKTVLIAIVTILLTGCASVKQSIVNREAGQGVKSWSLISQTKLEGSETTDKNDTSFIAQLNAIIGETKQLSKYNESEFIDMVRFELTGEYKLSLTPINKSDGFITISTSTTGMFIGTTVETVMVRFLSKDKSIIAQIKVSNDNLGAYVKSLDGMAQLTAKKIFKIIKSFN